MSTFEERENVRRRRLPVAVSRVRSIMRFYVKASLRAARATGTYSAGGYSLHKIIMRRIPGGVEGNHTTEGFGYLFIAILSLILSIVCELLK